MGKSTKKKYVEFRMRLTQEENAIIQLKMFHVGERSRNAFIRTELTKDCPIPLSKDDGKSPITTQFMLRLSEKETLELEEKMRKSGISNRERFMRSLIRSTTIKKIDHSELKEIRRLLANISNNINQIAKRCNETRSIYEVDVLSLADEVEKIRTDFETVVGDNNSRS